MWNSPRKTDDAGKRYEFADIAALVMPLDMMFDGMNNLSMADFAEERILQRLETSEYIYAIYEVFRALLEDVPVPEKGHPGIHEAMVADLLTHAYGDVVAEIETGDTGEYSQKIGWHTASQLLVFRYPNAPEMPWFIEKLGIPVSDFEPYKSPAFTLEIWEHLYTGEGGLFDEFLWDNDWRLEAPMDSDPEEAKQISEVMGMDLGTVHALAYTPNDEELQTAKSYLNALTAKLEQVFPFSD